MTQKLQIGLNIVPDIELDFGNSKLKFKKTKKRKNTLSKKVQLEEIDLNKKGNKNELF